MKADAYYAPYVNWAAQTGIVEGITATTFAPDTNINREQMAVIMKKVMLQSWAMTCFIPIRCKTLLDGGRGVQKSLYGVFKRTVRRDRSGSDLFHLRDGFEIKMNFDRNVSCFIFVNAFMHDDFFN